MWATSLEASVNNPFDFEFIQNECKKLANGWPYFWHKFQQFHNPKLGFTSASSNLQKLFIFSLLIAHWGVCVLSTSERSLIKPVMVAVSFTSFGSLHHFYFYPLISHHVPLTCLFFFLPFSAPGALWYNPGWESVRRCLRAHGWLPRGLLEVHSSSQQLSS